MTHSHMDYSVRFAIDPAAAAAMGTDELRHNFLIEDLFAPGRISLTYTHYDRLIVGGAMPVDGAARAGDDQADRHAELSRPPRTHRRQCRRRRARSTSRDEAFAIGSRDMIYVGMGAGSRVASPRATLPRRRNSICSARRRTRPIRPGLSGSTTPSASTSAARQPRNERSIFQFIHPEGVQDLPAGRRHDAAWRPARSGTPCPATSMTGARKPISISTSPTRRASST